MSDSESENSIQSRCSDDELEHLGQPRVSNESIKQPYTTVHAPSVEQSKTSVTSETSWQNIIYHFLLAAKVRYQWCVCVLSSPGWSRHSRTLIEFF